MGPPHGGSCLGWIWGTPAVLRVPGAGEPFGMRRGGIEGDRGGALGGPHACGRETEARKRGAVWEWAPSFLRFLLSGARIIRASLKGGAEGSPRHTAAPGTAIPGAGSGFGGETVGNSSSPRLPCASPQPEGIPERIPEGKWGSTHPTPSAAPRSFPSFSSSSSRRSWASRLPAWGTQGGGGKKRFEGSAAPSAPAPAPPLSHSFPPSVRLSVRPVPPAPPFYRRAGPTPRPRRLRAHLRSESPKGNPPASICQAGGTT